MIEIKFCENNFSKGTEEVINRLKEEADDIFIEVQSCLGYCGECSEGPFALVNEELVQGETPEELFDIIIEQL